MHLQEVFRAINTNHIYEYLVVDSNFNMIEHSDGADNYCEQKLLESKEPNVFELVPELIGMEKELLELLHKVTKPILIRYVSKKEDHYINIRVHRGKADKTLIVLFENVTETAKKDRVLVQDANEKALLLEELAEKNKQLKDYGERMQVLVEIETKKNLEKQKMLELASRHAQMGEMIGMITHQWKQPLNTINTICIFLELMKNKNKRDEETILKQINEIRKQVNYMNETVEDFQHFFNPSKEKHDFNVMKTIQTVIDLIQPEYALKKIRIELKGDKSVTAYGYANEYNQVLMSILKNAKDAFMQRPKKDMKIAIDVSQENGRSIVRVTDNAGGIEKEVIEKIFDVYVSTKKDGSGLGLNIAKNVIETNMNGEIKVRNVKDGAEFTVIV